MHAPGRAVQEPERCGRGPRDPRAQEGAFIQHSPRHTDPHDMQVPVSLELRGSLKKVFSCCSEKLTVLVNVSLSILSLSLLTLSLPTRLHLYFVPICLTPRVVLSLCLMFVNTCNCNVVNV